MANMQTWTALNNSAGWENYQTPTVYTQQWEGNAVVEYPYTSITTTIPVITGTTTTIFPTETYIPLGSPGTGSNEIAIRGDSYMEMLRAGIRRELEEEIRKEMAANKTAETKDVAFLVKGRKFRD